MKKYTFTIKEDVCAANGKDPNGTELLQIMTHYGSVEEYDRTVSAMKSEYQASIDSITSQLNAVKDQMLTSDEIFIIRAYRNARDGVIAEHIARNAELSTQLQNVINECEQRIHRVKEALGV